MKKSLMETAILFLALFMVCGVGLLAQGLRLAFVGAALELLCGSMIATLYRAVLLEERRAARKARQAARAHAAAAQYRSGSRIASAQAPVSRAANGLRAA